MSDTPSPDTPPGGTEIVRGSPPAVDREICAGCGGWRQARADFCETCGARVDDGASIVVDVFADREYYDTLDAAGLAFPTARRVRTLRFEGDEVSIGRHGTVGGERVGVDLTGELADPGASGQHVRLARTPDGRWVLVDVGSTNGTTINDSTAPIPVHSAVEVSVGDHVHVGAWTTIVIRSMHSSS
jgi:hypothetical protein